jgi:hypothetical protein
VVGIPEQFIIVNMPPLDSYFRLGFCKFFLLWIIDIVNNILQNNGENKFYQRELIFILQTISKTSPCTEYVNCVQY